jgi:hypothetical protein
MDDSDRSTIHGAPSSSVWSLITASRVLAKVTGDYKRGCESRFRKATDVDSTGLITRRALTRVGSMPEREMGLISAEFARRGSEDGKAVSNEARDKVPTGEVRDLERSNGGREGTRLIESGPPEVMQMMREIMSGVDGIKEQVLEEINSLKKEINSLKKQVSWSRYDHNNHTSLSY